jgi:hypothetical protein
VAFSPAVVSYLKTYTHPFTRYHDQRSIAYCVRVALKQFAYGSYLLFNTHVDKADDTGMGQATHEN